MEWLQICAELPEFPGQADGRVKGNRATKHSRSHHPCRLPHPRRPRWFLWDGSDPVFFSAGCGHLVMFPPPDRQGELLHHRCQNPLMSHGPHLRTGGEIISKLSGSSKISLCDETKKTSRFWLLEMKHVALLSVVGENCEK